MDKDIYKFYLYGHLDCLEHLEENFMGKYGLCINYKKFEEEIKAVREMLKKYEE